MLMRRSFLMIEGGSCAVLLCVAVFALGVVLPVNMYGGKVVMDDEFSMTTVNHVEKGSGVLWIHFLFVVVVVLLLHYGINEIEERLKITRFRDGLRNPSDPCANSTAIFTIMIQSVPKLLGANSAALEEYFQNKYPGKVYKVIVPMDLCALDDLATELVKVRYDISWLVAKMDSRLMPEEDEDTECGGSILERGLDDVFWLWRKMRNFWDAVLNKLVYTDDDRLRRLQELRA